MRAKKILLALLCSAVFASSAFAEESKSIGNLLNLLRDKFGAANEAAAEAVDKAVDKIVDSVFESEGPERALTVREPNSTYFVLRLDNLADFLRYVISKENLSVFAPFAELDEDAIKSITDCLAKLPMREAALLIGSADEATPLFQMAVSMPENMREKVDMVADGKATPKDIASLIIGEDSELLLVASGMISDARFEDGVYMLGGGAVALGAKDGMLLASISPADVRASIKAISDGTGRLPVKRTFDTKDFLIIHADPTVMAERVRTAAETDLPDVNLKKIFKGPIDSEMAFEAMADKFVVSGHIDPNCLTDEYLASLKKGRGYVFDIIGGDAPLFALGSDSVPSLEGIKDSIPDLKDDIDQLRQIPQMLGISDETAADLFSGGMSAVLTGSVAFDGARLPGGYLTFTGRNGAAAKVIDALLRESTTDGSGSAVNMEGWDSMMQVTPELIPVPLFIGAKGETLFVGVMNGESVTAPAAKLPDTLGAMVGSELSSAFFLDIKSLLNFLRDGKNGIAGLMAKFSDEDTAEMLADMIAFEPSLTCISMSSDPDDLTFKAEFFTADVPVEKGLWMKIMKYAALFGDTLDDGDDED